MKAFTMPAKKITTTTCKTFSATKKDRDAFRSFVLALEDNRNFRPMDLDAIRAACIDADKDKLEELIATGKKGTVEVSLQGEAGYNFLRSWMQANGKNRTPKKGHFGRLAKEFRSDYDSSCTHYVLTVSHMVANGGHSGVGASLAFWPESIFYNGAFAGEKHTTPEMPEGIPADSDAAKQFLEPDADGNSFGGLYYEQDGFVFRSVIPPIPEDLPRVGEYDDNGYIQGTDNPEYREGKDLTVNLVLNAPERACLKMDDVRLSADYEDFLEMVGPIKTHLTKLPSQLSPAQIGQIGRGWYLLTNGKRPEDTESRVQFGTLSKGGNLNKADIQQWYLTFIPLLMDAIESLKDPKGEISSHFHDMWNKSKSHKCGISLVNALIALMVLDEPGRQRLASVLTKGSKSEDLQKVASYLVLKADSTSTPPKADAIVRALIMIGLGKKDIASKMWQTYDPAKKYEPATADCTDAVQFWQVPEFRASGWDSLESDPLPDAEEDRNDTLEAMAAEVAHLLGDEEKIHSAARKANKGKGTRGPNRKKVSR